jgi:hypothetical protein
MEHLKTFFNRFNDNSKISPSKPLAGASLQLVPSIQNSHLYFPLNFWINSLKIKNLNLVKN